jgi:hypothetical protein
MDQVKNYKDVIDLINEPSSPSNSPDKNEDGDEYENSSSSSDDISFNHPRERSKTISINETSNGPAQKSGGFFAGMKGFFRSKKEEKIQKKLKSKAKKLPKDFAN